MRNEIVKKRKMDRVNKTLEGSELHAYFESQIVCLKTQFIDFFARFDGADLFHKWRELIRHVDELCNIQVLLPSKKISSFYGVV